MCDSVRLYTDIYICALTLLQRCVNLNHEASLMMIASADPARGGSLSQEKLELETDSLDHHIVNLIIIITWPRFWLPLQT